MILGLVLLALAHLVVRWRFVSRRSVTPIISATGADQILVFDAKYGYLLAVLILIWATCFAQMWLTQGMRELGRSIPLHWCVLTAAGVLAIPTTIFIPGFRAALVYIAERMSLAGGICVCAVIGSTRLRHSQRYALLGLALFFFSFLFHDEWKLNRFEDRIDREVAELPSGQRVVSAIVDFDLRAFAQAHMIDRACIGRCYSYANYEPSIAAFRVRATKPNPYVISDYRDSYGMQNGAYVFKERDLLVYVLEGSRSGQIAMRLLPAGAMSGVSEWHVLR